MKRTLIFLIAMGMGFISSAQETIDILSLSGRYGLPQEYKDAAQSGKATELGLLNSFQAGFDIGEKTMFVINLNHFYFNVREIRIQYSLLILQIR